MISTTSPPKVTKVSTAEAYVYTRRKSKDKGKAIMVEPATPKKVKKRTQVQLSMDEELARKMEEEKRARFNAEQEARALTKEGQKLKKGPSKPIKKMKPSKAVEEEKYGIYKLTRADGTVSFHGGTESLFRRLDRDDLKGDLRMMFDPDEQDEIWKNQESWKLQAEEESTMTFELIKFTRSQMKENGKCLKESLAIEEDPIQKKLGI
ncbi:hypothetical protein Tco_0575976 [Tanacetum coccineum]